MRPTTFGLDDPAPPEIARSVLAVGNFDAVHRGHHRLIAALRAQARRLGVPAAILCLYPHPLSILRPEFAPPTLNWPERRAALLCESGADAVAFLRTTPELLVLSADEFFKRLLLDKLHVRGLVEGENFRFGRGRGGDVHLLRTLSNEAGFSTAVVALADEEDSAVSSTRIRRAITDGALELAADLAGRKHRIKGRVGVGAKRGRTIGFPTANLQNVTGLVPAPGVYVTRVHLADGSVFGGACNIGPNPTFGEEALKIETHLLDFSSDLCGQELEIEFLRRLRLVMTFSSIENLRAQIGADLIAAREVLAATPPEPFGAELAVTIAEWIRWDAQAALDPIGVRLRSAAFVEPGVLRLDWRFEGPSPAHAAFDLLFGLDERLRRVFPEVAHIVSATT